MSKIKQIAEGKLFQIILGVGGIYYCFLSFGLLQEKIFNYNYSGRPFGPRFKSAFSIVLLISFFSYIISALIHKFICKNTLEIDQVEQSKFGFYNTASMISSNSALTMVSFPIQALVKSSKILSVMLVSFIFGGKKHEIAQYINATLISIGIFLYNYYNQDSKKGSDRANSIFGLLLLLFSLITDGLLADKQHTIFEQFNKKNQRFNQFALMKYTSKYTFIFCLLYGAVTMQIQDFLNFIFQNPAIVNDLIRIAFMGTMGSISIYYTISCFGPIILSFVTTSRKFLTVILSLIYYQHELNNIQMLAIFMVFVGIIVEFIQNTIKHQKKKQKEERFSLFSKEV